MNNPYYPPSIHFNEPVSNSELDIFNTFNLDPNNIKLRNDQYHMADSLQDLKYSILQAPCGWGKTIVAKYIMARDIHTDKVNNKNKIRTHIILVPKTHLAKSYATQCYFDYFPESIHFHIPNSQCFGNNLRICKDFRKFLDGRNKNENPVAVLTHAGFSLMWKKFNDEEKRKMVKNTTFYVDECHHLTEVNEEETHTKLGEIIDLILDMNDSTTQVRLMTATLFRGDHKPILSTKHRKKFKKRQILFEDYLRFTGIKSFNFDYIIYNNDPLEQMLSVIKKHKDLKQIIVLPRKKSKGRTEDTHLLYLKALKKIFPPHRVLDLIEDKSNIRQKRLADLKNNPEDFDIILSCNIFIEGSDWPPAAVIHNLSFGDSLLKINQIIGRILRSYPGKDAVYSYAYIQNGNNEELNRTDYSDRFNALLVVMVAEDMLRSIQLPDLPRTKTGIVTDSPPDYIVKVLQGEMIKSGIFLYYENKKEAKKAYSHIDALVHRLFTAPPDEINLDELKHYFKNEEKLSEFLRAHVIKTMLVLGGASRKEIEGVNIESIRDNFDHIWEKAIDNCNEVFGTKNGLDASRFEHFRKVIEPFMEDLYITDVTSIRISADDFIFKSYSKKGVVPTKNILDKWIKINIPKKGEITGRVISTDPLTARVYKDIKIKDRVVINNKCKYWSKGSFWVPHHMTSDMCKRGVQRNSWIRDEEFGNDINLEEDWITYQYPLKEVIL